jgi:hypothetical protein
MFSSIWLTGLVDCLEERPLEPLTGLTGEFIGVVSLLEGAEGAADCIKSRLLLRRGGFGIASFLLLETKPKSLLSLGWRSGVEWTEETLCFLVTSGVIAL